MGAFSSIRVIQLFTDFGSLRLGIAKSAVVNFDWLSLAANTPTGLSVRTNVSDSVSCGMSLDSAASTPALAMSIPASFARTVGDALFASRIASSSDRGRASAMAGAAASSSAVATNNDFMRSIT